MKKALYGFTVREMVEIAVLCAIAIVLDKFVTVDIGATGGSLNISMVPIFIVSLRHGWFKGFIAGGIVFGVISCLLYGYGFGYYPLEYFVAFGSTCILGFFGGYINKCYNEFYTSTNDENNKNYRIFQLLKSFGLIFVCVLAWAVIRFFAGVADTLIFYPEFTFVEALLYHVGYVFASAGVVMIILMLLLHPISVINKRFTTPYLNEYGKNSLE